MHTLDEDFEVTGVWWLPSETDNKVSGTLSFNRQGIALDLYQSFTPVRGTISPGDSIPEHPIVHGTTTKGEAVTLFDAQEFLGSINMGSGGVVESGHIRASLLVFGSHIPSHLQLTKVNFRVPNLQVWLGKEIINLSSTFDGHDVEEWLYKLLPLPGETIHISSINANLSWYYSWTCTHNDYRFIDVNVSAWVSFDSEDAKPIDWFLEQRAVLLTMLSLLSGHAFAADAIQARDNSGSVLDVLRVTPPVEKVEHNYPRNFLLSCMEISKPFEEYCNEWFDIYTDIKRPASLARSVLASRSLWSHVEFLSLMQALEGFHRAFYEGNYMEETKYEGVKHTLTSAIPHNVGSDYKEALKSRIHYGNEISLRKRLNELADKLSDKLRAYIFGESKKMPNSWIDTRNYYTHWDDALLSNVLNIQSIVNVNLRMRCLLHVLYALKMGISSDDLEKALGGSSRIAQDLMYVNAAQKRQNDTNYTPQPIAAVHEVSSDEIESEEE